MLIYDSCIFKYFGYVCFKITVLIEKSKFSKIYQIIEPILYLQQRFCVYSCSFSMIVIFLLLNC